MKDLKHATRSGSHPPVRSVRLQIRGYQVTVKVKTAVPQTPSTKSFILAVILISPVWIRLSLTISQRSVFVRIFSASVIKGVSTNWSDR